MGTICLLLQLYLLALFARILLSWFPVTPGTAMATIAGTLHSITEPVLGPIRRTIPPVRFGAAAIDLSPIIVLLGLQLLMSAIGC